MKLNHFAKTILALTVFATGAVHALQAPSPIGIFETHADIGITPKPGSASYDPATSEYRITGGGANMWAGVDAFHFVWKKISGDGMLGADVGFPAPGGNAHRKACLILRQSLEADSAYADAALRSRLASWEAHNGPHPRGASFPKRLGAFLWGEFKTNTVLRINDRGEWTELGELTIGSQPPRKFMARVYSLSS
jgi:hypothetical protein